MAKKAAGTPATVLLAKEKVRHTLHPYEVSPDAPNYGALVAEALGVAAEQVFKTLVARGDRTGVLLAVVPGGSELDLKALARLSGDRKVDTVSLKEVQPLTGYVRGGVTALAGKKDYPVFVDETIELFDLISVSAGARGTQLLLAPGDYLRAVQGTVGAISKEKE